MYQVYCDSFLLFDDRLESLKIYGPNVELEVNKTGSFTFTMYSDHPYFNQIKKLKSIITVKQDDFLLFRGRVLNDEVGIYNEKLIECEGELSFLLDSIIRPYEYSGNIKGFLQKIIAEHNAQVDAAHQFTVGNVNVTDSNDTITRSSIDYVNSWEVINKSLLELLGGYIRVRRENNISYIDYVSDFSTLSTQGVEFAKNLLEIKRIRNGDAIKTALIPLGAKIEGTEERLTIKEVNGGLDYIYDQDAVNAYGWIFETNIWDDVTEAKKLLTKGKAHLATLVKLPEIIELSAADMATINADVNSFHIGTYVKVKSKPHGIEQNFLVSKLSINLLNPGSNKLVLGGMVESFTSKTVGAISVSVHDGKDGKDGEDAVVLRIDSSRGTVFKNNQVSTTLTVAIYFGDKRIINKAELSESFGASAHLEWWWQRMDESTFGVISASDSRIKDEGFSLVLSPDDVDTKATFMCKLII